MCDLNKKKKMCYFSRQIDLLTFFTWFLFGNSMHLYVSRRKVCYVSPLAIYLSNYLRKMFQELPNLLSTLDVLSQRIKINKHFLECYRFFHDFLCEQIKRNKKLTVIWNVLCRTGNAYRCPCVFWWFWNGEKKANRKKN